MYLSISWLRIVGAMAAHMEAPLKRWEVVFEGVAVPVVLASKLQGCPFYKRSRDPSVSVEGAVVKFVFSADLDQNAVRKKCTQTFAKYGTYATLRVVELSTPIGFLVVRNWTSKYLEIRIFLDMMCVSSVCCSIYTTVSCWCCSIHQC
jgi:hypothetical protein